MEDGFFFNSDMLAEHLANTYSILSTSFFNFYSGFIIGLKSGRDKLFFFFILLMSGAGWIHRLTSHQFVYRVCFKNIL